MLAPHAILDPGEATAHFTFCAERFDVKRYTNGGLPFSLSERGEFGIFLKETPGSSFDDPQSLTVQKCEAVGMGDFVK